MVTNKISIVSFTPVLGTSSGSGTTSGCIGTSGSTGV